MNFKNIIVIDTETNNNDPNVASPVQLAAKVIDPRRLIFLPDAEFNSFIKPDPATTNQQTVEFHAKRLKKTPQQIVEDWETYPDPKVVWPEFLKFLRQYHTTQDRQSIFSAPIPAGNNIIYFDLPILNRYHTKYGDEKALFANRDVVDLLHWFFPWFENSQEVEKFNMDYMRTYFGMPKENAHDALQDVKDSGEVIIRFMKLYRATAAKVKFKNAFKNDKEVQSDTIGTNSGDAQQTS